MAWEEEEIKRLKDEAKANSGARVDLSARAADRSGPKQSKEVARTIAELEKFYVILAGWGWRKPEKIGEFLLLLSS